VSCPLCSGGGCAAGRRCSIPKSRNATHASPPICAPLAPLASPRQLLHYEPACFSIVLQPTRGGHNVDLVLQPPAAGTAAVTAGTLVVNPATSAYKSLLLAGCIGLRPISVSRRAWEYMVVNVAVLLHPSFFWTPVGAGGAGASTTTTASSNEPYAPGSLGGATNMLLHQLEASVATRREAALQRRERRERHVQQQQQQQQQQPLSVMAAPDQPPQQRRQLGSRAAAAAAASGAALPLRNGLLMQVDDAEEEEEEEEEEGDGLSQVGDDWGVGHLQQQDGDEEDEGDEDEEDANAQGAHWRPPRDGDGVRDGERWQGGLGNWFRWGY